jgi:predicted amidophosphoribosyltransferase
LAALVLCGIVVAFAIFKRRGGGAKKQCGYCRSWVSFNAPFCPKCGYEFIIG